MVNKARSILTDRRRELRKSPTIAEKQLWVLLRRFRSDGYIFRRQQSIGWYIADFYCDKAKLVIELDGPIHEDAVEYDKIRDEFMKSNGLTILRFKNEEITNDPSGALKLIKTSLARSTGEGMQG